MFNLEGRTIGFFLARWIGYRSPESLDTTVHPPSWWTLFHRTWNWARTIIHSPVKTMIIFALQLYIGAELSEEIIGEESAPKGVNQPPSRVHRNFRTNDRHLPFTSEEVDFHLLFSPSPSSSFLFLERSHEEFQVWGEVGRMRWKVVGPRMD